jgi:hypothetical protein
MFISFDWYLLAMLAYPILVFFLGYMDKRSSK